MLLAALTEMMGLRILIAWSCHFGAYTRNCESTAAPSSLIWSLCWKEGQRCEEDVGLVMSAWAVICCGVAVLRDMMQFQTKTVLDDAIELIDGKYHR